MYLNAVSVSLLSPLARRRSINVTFPFYSTNKRAVCSTPSHTHARTHLTFIHVSSPEAPSVFRLNLVLGFYTMGTGWEAAGSWSWPLTST